MKCPCLNNQIKKKYASDGIWRWTSRAPACELVISLGTIELSSKWPAQAQLLKQLNSKLRIFIGSCCPVWHKKWNLEWIKNEMCIKTGLTTEKEYDHIFTSLCHFWEGLHNEIANTKKALWKATWVWFPISLPTVSLFSSEALRNCVWLPTASDLVRLKSFFKQQSAFRDLVEGDMMLGRTTKLRQRNVFPTRDQMLEVPWGAGLWHSYIIADSFSKLGVGWVPLDSLAQTSSAK